MLFSPLGFRASLLVLAFERVEETRYLLESAKRFLKFKHDVHVYVNGGNYRPFFEFINEKLVDKLHVSLVNEGSGAGTIRLIQSSTAETFIYLQNDNFFRRTINEIDLDGIETCLDMPNVGAIDLTGLVPKHAFSERAFIARKSYYLANPDLSIGGTGPLYHLKGTEPAFTEYMAKTNRKVMAAPGLMVGDSGKFAILEIGGGVFQRRCDTQELKVLKQPTSQAPCFNLSDEEWQLILKNEWRDWRIPEASIPWVFLFFSDKFEDPENRKYLK